MSAKLHNSKETWVDPDDAPELGDEFFQEGVWKIGDRTVSREEAQVEAAKIRRMGTRDIGEASSTIQVDAAVVEEFKATGEGWEARMNDVLREWLVSHPESKPGG
jgi:uncharacterized protein (DUF4415 family)